MPSFPRGKLNTSLERQGLFIEPLSFLGGVGTHVQINSFKYWAVSSFDGVIRHIFNSMKSISKSEVVSSGLFALQREHESRYKAAQREYTKAAADLAELKSEVLKAIRGQSKFTPDLLNEIIAEAEKELSGIEAVRDTSKRELDGCKYRREEIQAQYDEVISWTELYDAADLTAKKMIIANLINRIEVGTDYDIHIDFNIDLSQFNIDCSIPETK